MLEFMQQLAQPHPAPASFAGLLAALTGPRAQPASDDFESLKDDVVTLSYESALHAHARYLPAHEPETPVSAAANAFGGRAGEGDAAAPQKPASVAQSGIEANPEAKLEQRRKRASVTLRMNNAERAQLEQRAAEAGLTISAYLRSCAFEVERLRSQVKQALAELRAAKAALELPAPTRRWTRLFHRGA